MCSKALYSAYGKLCYGFHMRLSSHWREDGRERGCAHCERGYIIKQPRMGLPRLCQIKYGVQVKMSPEKLKTLRVVGILPICQHPRDVLSQTFRIWVGFSGVVGRYGTKTCTWSFKLSIEGILIYGIRSFSYIVLCYFPDFFFLDFFQK